MAANLTRLSANELDVNRISSNRTVAYLARLAPNETDFNRVPYNNMAANFARRGADEVVSQVIKGITGLLVKEAFTAMISLVYPVNKTVFIQVKKRMTKIKNDLEYFKPFLSKISEDRPQRTILKTWLEKVSAIAEDAQKFIQDIEDILEKRNRIVDSLLESLNKKDVSKMWEQIDERLKGIQTKVRKIGDSDSESPDSTRNRWLAVRFGPILSLSIFAIFSDFFVIFFICLLTHNIHRNGELQEKTKERTWVGEKGGLGSSAKMFL